MAQVLIAHEFQCAPQDLERFTVDSTMSLSDIAKAHNLTGYIANVGGGENDFVFDAEWENTIVAEDNVVIFVNVPEGDDSDVIGFIVAIAIAFIAPQISLALLGSSTGIALTATTIGLQLAAAALLPPPEQPRPQKIPEPSPQYSARVQVAIARLGEPVPVQFGRVPNVIPDVVSPEFYDFIGNEQYVSMRFCLGMHRFIVHSLSFKNILIDDIPDAQYEIVGPGETGTLLPANTYPAFDVPGGQVTEAWTASAFSCPKGVEVDKIGLDVGLLGGFGIIGNSGDISDHTVTMEFRYRLVNDTNTPTSSWSVLFVQSLTDATFDPIRKSYETAIPQGRHEIQMRMLEVPSDDTKTRDNVTWGGLRGMNDDHVVLDDRTLINVRLRITEGSSKLIGDTLRNFTVDCTAINREYDGSQWLENVASRSMPWAFAKAYSDANLGSRDVNRLWVDDLKTLHDKLENLNHHFDFRFDQKLSLLEALQFIARYGRCVAIPYFGTFVLVRDEPQEAITHVFQPDNCRGFSLEVENVQGFDHVIMTYSDPVTGQPKEAIFSPAGSLNERPNRVAFLACSSRQHALSEAEHFYFANKETITASLETNNLKKPITFGSRVLVPQTRRMARQYGVIKKRVGNTLTLSNPHGIDLNAGAASIAFDDGFNDAIVLNVLNVVNDYVVTIEAIPVDLDIIDSYQSQEPTVYLLQDMDVKRRIMRVRSIGGETSEGWIKVNLVSEGVEEPVIDPSEDNNNNLPVVGENLTIRNLVITQRPNGDDFVLICAVDALPDADSYLCQINDQSGAWRTVYSGVEPQWRFGEKVGSLQIRVAAIGSVQGAWFTKTIQVGDSDESIGVPAPGEVTGSFVSGELVMQAAQVKGAAKYRWEIYDTSTMTLRHSVDTDYKFTYSRDQAIADGGPWRSVTVRVYSIDAADNVSDIYIQKAFSDAQLPKLTNVEAVGFTNQILVTWDYPAAIDAYGVLIYASLSAGFVPSVFNLIGDARGKQFSFPVNAGEIWNIRVAAYDLLGQDGLTYSDQIRVTAGKLGPSELELNTVRDAVITANSITASKIADSSISTPKIISGSITSAKIATGAIVALKIAANAITSAKITANAITADKINVNSLSAITSNIGTIIAGLIKSADNRFQLNLNATGASYRIFQKNLSNQTTFYLTAAGDAFLKGHLHAETFSTTNAVIDTLHIKDHAISVETSVTNLSRYNAVKFSWRSAATLTRVIPVTGNPVTINVGCLQHSEVLSTSTQGDVTYHYSRIRVCVRIRKTNQSWITVPWDVNYTGMQSNSQLVMITDFTNKDLDPFFWSFTTTLTGTVQIEILFQRQDQGASFNSQPAGVSHRSIYIREQLK